MKNPLHILAKIYGYKLVPNEEKISKDMDADFQTIYEMCRDQTMTSLDNMYSLYASVKYIVESGIDGDLVECGVWKGGSAMLMAETLLLFGENKRKIYLYDTFEGMPEPDDIDVKIRTHTSGKEMWQEKQQSGGWAVAGKNEVRKNLEKTKYPKENFVFVKGKVEETIPRVKPQKISILRLDTDWFSSTYHELTHLYPILNRGGILIIDDYGSWSGSKEATDKYFSENNTKMYLNRVDTSRLGVKS